MQKLAEKIGIGIVTYNRESLFSTLYESISSMSDNLYLAFTGQPYIKAYKCLKSKQFDYAAPVGHGKNWLLQEMHKDGCVHMFILEDDIQIINTEVFFKYIELSNITKIKHFLFGYHGKNNKTTQGKPNPRVVLKLQDKLLAFNRHCVGALEYFHKDVIDIVGYYDTEYANALEHVDHSFEIVKKGFLPAFWWWPDLANSHEYIIDNDPYGKLSIIMATNNIRANTTIANNYFIKKHNTSVASIPDITLPHVIRWIQNNFNKK